MRWITLLALTALASCAAKPKIKQLPAFEAAIALADHENPKMPKVFVVGEHSDASVFELVPYCEAAWVREGGNLRDGAARGLEHLIEHMPDAVLCSEGRTEVGAVVTNHLFWGVSSGSVATSTPTKVLALRSARAILPFRWDLRSLMVRQIHDSSKCGELIEGDTIATVNGIDMADRDVAYSALPAEWIQATPGTKVRIEWIRPGKGRMQGEVEMIENPRDYLKSPSAFDIKRNVKLAPRDDGTPRWRMASEEESTGWVRHGAEH